MEERRSRWLGSLAGLAVFAGLSAGAALLGASVAKKRANQAWYRRLRKPGFTPPDRAFSLVWPVLYSLGTWSAWRVARAPSSPLRTRALALWGVQIASNAAWTPAFFGSHRPRLALGILAGNLASLGAYALAASKVDQQASALVTPQLGWLGFAGALNTAIAARN